ncbi:MAG: hypothetical protein SVT56_10145 [Chloroflexota bacterium]|nr:hypothetical protein [Chloroflexota bacterium]
MTINKKTTRMIIALIPFLIATLILLPRLLSPQFGFFDDASTLSQSHRFLNGDFSMSHDKQAGRFRPVYWLYFTIIFAFAGYQPFWFFLTNLFLLFILLIEIRRLIQRMGGSDLQILIASLLFIFSMPIVESFYTLSKGEPLQLIFILAADLIATPKRESTKHTLWIRNLQSALFFLLALMVKETTIVMLPVTFLWALYISLTKDKELEQYQKRYWFLFGASALAAMIYFFLRSTFGFPFITGGTYSNNYMTDLGALLQKLLRWITQFAFYFHYMIPLILLFIVLILMENSPLKRWHFEVFKWAIWWAFWILILVPWEYAELYYLLPFALGGAILIGVISAPALDAIQQQNGWVRSLTIACSALVIALFLLTLPNYRTDARTQLAFDKLNAEMLSDLVKVTPDNGTVFINIETTNEYSEKIEAYLRDHYQKPDIDYNNIDAHLMDEILDQSQAIVVIPSIENQPNLTVRAGIEETYQDSWNIEFMEKTEGHRQLIKAYQNTFRLSNVNLPTLICPLGISAGFCQDPDPLFDFRTLTYGWEIYQIQ